MGQMGTCPTNLECLLDLLLRISVLHLPRHHGKKFGEIDRLVSVGVDLLGHVG